MTNAIISFNNVTKSFGKHVLIFDAVDLEMPGRQVIGLLGGNGSGKTTFIRLIGGLIKPDIGDIQILGYKTDAEGDVRKIRKDISILGDANRALYWNLSGLENIRYFWTLKTGKAYGEISEDILRLINEFNMETFIHKKVESYSKGMKQRLLFVIALLNSPKLLVLDEPLNGLDFDNALRLKTYIKKYVETMGGTVLITCHDHGFMEEMCDMQYEIKSSKIVKKEGVFKNQRNVKVYFKVTGNLEESLLAAYSTKTEDSEDLIYHAKGELNDELFYRVISDEISNQNIELLDILG